MESQVLFWRYRCVTMCFVSRNDFLFFRLCPIVYIKCFLWDFIFFLAFFFGGIPNFVLWSMCSFVMHDIFKKVEILIKILFAFIVIFELKKNMEQSCLNLTFFTCYFTTDILVVLFPKLHFNIPRVIFRNILWRRGVLWWLLRRCCFSNIKKSKIKFFWNWW